METKIVKNENGSVHVMGGPLTTAITNQEMPELLLSDVDSRLVKVRPMATPIDQISRLAPSRKCDSMDFLDVAVWSIESALEAAFNLGRASVK